jgi:hypothetical protein
MRQHRSSYFRMVAVIARAPLSFNRENEELRFSSCAAAAGVQL